MATWNGVITNAGNSILTEWVNEKTLSFDSAATGQGTVPTQAMLAQTALVSQKQTASLLGGEKVDAGIRLKIRIAAPDTAYTLNQYGVWASVNGGQSSLVALFQLEEGIPIPSKTESPDFVYTFYALIMCSNTGSWTVTVDTSVGVTEEDMQEAINTAIATREGLLKDASMKGSLVDGDSLAIIDSADNSNTKRVLWSTIKSTLSGLFVPLTSKINNKSLSSDVTLTGADINVSGSDQTTVETALSNKVTVNNGTAYDLDTATNPGGYTWYDSKNIMGAGTGALFNLRVLTLPYMSAGQSIVQELTCTYPTTSAGITLRRTYYPPTGWTIWVRQATATNPQEYSLPLADGLTGTAIYSKDQFGRVSLYLNLTADGTISHGATLCTLPSGYRPIKTESTIIESNSNPGTVENRKPIDVRVDPAGNVSVLYCYDNIADKTEMLIGRISFPAYG